MATESRTRPLPARQANQPRMAAAVLLLPALAVIGLLALLIAVRHHAESTVADLATLIPLGWAFAAGMVASVNPCGFFMLPAYLSYQLGARGALEQSSRARRVSRALGLGVVATSGFLLILAAVGLVIASGGKWLIRTFPYAGVTIGTALTLLGVWMLRSGRTMELLAASRTYVVPHRSVRNVFLFGIAYAAGSLSCTLPVFLLVIGTSLASQSLLASFSQFISFGLGMGTILMGVTIGAALFQDALHGGRAGNRPSCPSPERVLSHRRGALPRLLLGLVLRLDPLNDATDAAQAAHEREKGSATRQERSPF